MRSLRELINDQEPAWPQIQQWVAAAKIDVEMLPAEKKACEAALVKTQVTTRSPMGAMAYHVAGLLVDAGWLRILGAGKHARLERSLPEWNVGRGNGFYLVADDVLGGSFAMNGGALGPDKGNIYYFAPDTLAWEGCSFGYSQFLVWALSPQLSEFYAPLRWKGWEKEVRKLTADQSLNVVPPLFTQGPPIGERSRRAVPVNEQYELQFDMRKQLDAGK